MTANTKLIPSGSQTVGPYFRIGLQHLIDRESASAPRAETIELRGKVIDCGGAPVPDALVEFWCAYGSLDTKSEAKESGIPAGFHRVSTDENGRYSATLIRPKSVPVGGSTMQAPHFLVLFFARGLLRHLLTRVYLANDCSNETDPVLLRIPPERRHTLIAVADQSDSSVFDWNIVLQGKDETAFFAW